MIDEPTLVSAQQMEEWVNDFDAWDVCDQVCGNLFDKTPYAYQKAKEWCQQEKEFVRRVFGWRLDIFRLQNCLDEFIGPGGDFHFQGFWERSRRCFARVHRPGIDFLWHAIPPCHAGVSRVFLSRSMTSQKALAIVGLV